MSEALDNKLAKRDVGKPLRGSGDSPNAKYAVGYGRPPLHSRFKPEPVRQSKRPPRRSSQCEVNG